MWTTIGSLEVAAVVGLIAGIWVPLPALLASVGIIALMLGAIVVRARAGQRSAQPYLADGLVLLIAPSSVILNALAL